MRIVSLKEQRTEIVTEALNDLAEGRLNNGGVVTLAAGAASTTVSRVGVAVGDFLGFMPLTSNAAAEIGAGTMYVLAANITKNQFIITHANNGQTDRTFRYVFFATQTARH